MKTRFAGVTPIAVLATVAMIQLSSLAMADASIWANAKRVKATFTDCGALRYLILRDNAVDLQTPPDSPGCTSSEKVLIQVNVAKPFFKSGNNGPISESNVDAGYLQCNNGDALLILGRSAETNNAMRRVPAPQGCTFTKLKFQHVSSVGGISFTNVANGGTMSVTESLAMHAKERERAIALCNASAACQAEVRRMSAINTYYDCISPKNYARTCYRPW